MNTPSVQSPKISEPHPRRTRTRALSLIVVAVLGLAGSVALAGEAAAQTAAIHTTADVNIRSQPTSASARVGGIANGTTLTTIDCATSGESVGGLNVWMHLTINGVTGYYASAYDDAHYSSWQDLLNNYGIPQCGGTPVASGDPLVWVGSPFRGNWPNTSGCPATFPSYACSLPASHNIAYGGDWAADLQGITANTPVVLYAAPNDGTTPITARVDTVGPACASGVISAGGYRVVVSLWAGSTSIGKVTYAHVNPSVSQGATINRWGTQIGVAGSYTPGSCWTGVHTHVEMFSTHNFACYNGTWAPGQAMNASNFIGFVGGNKASGPRRACP